MLVAGRVQRVVFVVGVMLAVHPAVVAIQAVLGVKEAGDIVHSLLHTTKTLHWCMLRCIT